MPKSKVIQFKGTNGEIIERRSSEVVKAMNNIIRDNKTRSTDEMIINNLINGEGNGVLLPSELRHDLDKERKRNKSIRQYVDVIPVDAPNGILTTEAEDNSQNELIALEDEEFDVKEQDIKLKGVNWNIKARGSFTAIHQSLAEDSAYDLTKTFNKNHAEKATKTENNLVFAAIKQGLQTKNLDSIDALNNSLIMDINPALESEMVIITNQSGYKIMKPNLDFFKDSNGEIKAYFDKYLVETYSDDELTSSAGTVPVIYGSIKRAVKLFDLERTEFMLSKYPFGIQSRISMMRGIEHFDVKFIPNSTEVIYGELPTA